MMPPTPSPSASILLPLVRRAASRAIHSTTPRNAAITPPPPPPLAAKKPMGAFRGGLFGFLLGCTVAGSSVYTYLVHEYKVSNDMLNEDIYTLQSSVLRLTDYVKKIEQIAQEKKK